MLTVATTILALLAASFIVWFGYRRARAIRQVSGQLSGPVEEMKEQLLLTADSAIDRLDSKMAQMEILLAELDRRSNLLAQQSQRQQVHQNQLEQQQQQLTLWFVQQRRALEQENVSARGLLEKLQSSPPQPLPVVEVQSVAAPIHPVSPAVVPIAPRPAAKVAPPEEKPPEQALSRPQKTARASSANQQPVADKRTVILELAEQGMAAEDIAKKMGVGKGEVMLLLKLRKKATS